MDKINTVPYLGQENCCIIDEKGNQCPQKQRFYVGTNGTDDYTLVCGDHVQDVKRPGDKVLIINQ